MTVSTRRDFEWLEGWNDIDSEPVSTQVNARRFYLDFYYGHLTWASHAYVDGLLWLSGEGTNGRSYRLDAHLSYLVKDLGLTNGNPRVAWPVAQCDPEGTVREQIACGSD